MIPSRPRSTVTLRGPRRTGRSGAAGAASGRRSLTGAVMARGSASGLVAQSLVARGLLVHGRLVHDLGRALLEKSLEPRFRLLVGLGDRRDQRLGEIAGGGIGLSDPRQHLGDREI